MRNYGRLVSRSRRILVEAIEFIYEPSATVRQPATDLSETRTTAMRAEFNYGLVDTAKQRGAIDDDSRDVTGIWAVVVLLTISPLEEKVLD